MWGQKSSLALDWAFIQLSLKFPIFFLSSLSPPFLLLLRQLLLAVYLCCLKFISGFFPFPCPEHLSLLSLEEVYTSSLSGFFILIPNSKFVSRTVVIMINLFGLCCFLQLIEQIKICFFSLERCIRICVFFVSIRIHDGFGFFLGGGGGLISFLQSISSCDFLPANRFFSLWRKWWKVKVLLIMSFFY